MTDSWINQYHPFASKTERPLPAPINLDIAIVYDIETPEPRVFTFHCVELFSDAEMTFEISCYRDDRVALLAWFDYWHATETPMIGFNNVAFDYVVIHFIWQNPYCSVKEIYAKSQEVIHDHTPFSTVWQSDRFAPQIDLFLLHHFNNRAKMTSLKALQFAMRSESVMEMPIPFGTPLTEHEVRTVLIPYNGHDSNETKKFAHYSLDAIKFRIGLSETLRGDCVNWNDSKIGSKILEQRLGDELCYTWESGRKEPRRSMRDTIPLADIIFPYVEFRHPEFNRILSWMRTQTLSADELTENIKTKGVFTGVHATVGGIDFHFGTGGIHGSVESQRFAACDQYALVDIDVASLYPNIAIVNNLAPEHLGQRFVEEYSKLPKERKEWQIKKGKKSTEANSMKLASNGTYGNSNNQYSPFYDPKFTMTITINGQLLLCMLAEWLLTVETLQIIQINTDGITYRCRRDRLEHARIVQCIWERRTALVLEEAQYSRMWIRDVNSYVGESLSGELKQKGAYWFPRVFPDDISNSQPPAWHKDYSAQVVIKAAVEHMITGTDIERFIYGHSDPFDFMCRAKVNRASRLMIGTEEVQRICRYYIATNGGAMRKVSPPVEGATVGSWKRKSGISDFEWSQAPQDGTWDSRWHTKNRSKYEVREMGIESGFLVAECNVASRFDFSNLNYDWYVDAAKKLVIPA